MRDVATGLAEAVGRAAVGLAEAVGGAAGGWLVLAVALHLANQVARGRGWFALVRMVRTGDPPVAGEPGDPSAARRSGSGTRSPRGWPAPGWAACCPPA